MNQFNFKAHEPLHPAARRGLVLDSTLRGEKNQLQGQQCFGAKVGIADVIDLLIDIEHRITTRDNARSDVR